VSRPAGFTLLELLVVVGVLAVLLAILLPVMRRARRASQSVTCLSNLHQINVAFHLFAQSNGRKLPDPGVTRMSWESSLLPYTKANLYECPADGELYPSLGSSYDWRDTPDPATTLAGKDFSEALRASLVLVFDALPAWHAKTKINAALLDGSAQAMEYEECLSDLNTPNDRPVVVRKMPSP
jgi:prepilin-type N-terminal cleavage/methylation domain-containing protein